MAETNHRLELGLLGLLALLWGSSYLFTKVAVQEIPPVTLVAIRVSVAAVFLLAVVGIRRESLPRDRRTWAMLGLQAFMNSFGAWTILAWGQQFVDAGLACVLNSTSPIFVFLFTAAVTRHEALGPRRLLGAVIGISGVTLIVGADALKGLGDTVAGQLACLFGAALYGAAAIYGRRFAHISASATAAGTMIMASAAMVPAALLIDQPWTLAPGMRAIAAMAMLSVFSTGVALLLYFRLVRTLGSLGVASQSYLRAGVGVMLGILVLGESLSVTVAMGLGAAVLGVVLINWPGRAVAAKPAVERAG